MCCTCSLMIPLLHLVSHEETHSVVKFEHKPLQNALAPKQVRAVWGDGGEDPVIIRKTPEMTQSVATSGGETVVLFGQLTERSEETGTGDVTSGKREMPPDRDTCTGQPCTGVNKTMILDRPEVVVVSDDLESEEKGVPKQTEDLGGPGSDQNKQESCNTKKQGDESLTCEGEREPPGKPSKPSAEVIQSQRGDPQDEVRKAWSGEDITPSAPSDSDPHEETSKDKAMDSSDPTSTEERGRMSKSNISSSNEPASTASKAPSATPPTALPPGDAPQPDKENVEKETGIRKEKREELEKDNQPEPEQQIAPPPPPQDKGGVAADRIFQLLQDKKSKEELLLHEEVACK